MAKHRVGNAPQDTLPSMPLAPGNALAGEPAPKHVVHEGPLPAWLDPTQAKFTKQVVAAMDREREDKAGTFDVTVKNVEADEAKLRDVCERVPTPRALRTPSR